MFRISLRELILLAAVVSLAAGWWADRAATKRRHDLRLSAIESLLRREGWIVTQDDGSVSFRHKDGKREGYLHADWAWFSRRHSTGKPTGQAATPGIDPVEARR